MINALYIVLKEDLKGLLNFLGSTLIFVYLCAWVFSIGGLQFLSVSLDKDLNIINPYGILFCMSGWMILIGFLIYSYFIRVKKQQAFQSK